MHCTLSFVVQSKLRLDADDVDEYEDPAEDEEDAVLQRKALQHISEHKLLPYDSECCQASVVLRQKNVTRYDTKLCGYEVIICD
jgi:hypothetical protein